ncbi:GNAT family N-acetyltransferase [Nocardiopsis dassonvillei]|nr:GNAT family N-acetyltransferase [Nocardiopsis dassonvillei]
MLADDELGARREDPGNPAPYLAAFEVIDADPHQFLAVARRGDRVVGTLQLTFLPGLSHRGATRAQVEAVRVHSDVRGGGLGTDLLAWAEEEARRRGAAMLQLTSDASREDAHRFYERLGYTASHVGFKKRLG